VGLILKAIYLLQVFVNSNFCIIMQTDMPEWAQTPQVNAKFDAVMKLLVFGIRTGTLPWQPILCCTGLIR